MGPIGEAIEQSKAGELMNRIDGFECSDFSDPWLLNREVDFSNPPPPEQGELLIFFDPLVLKIEIEWVIGINSFL